MFKNLYSPYKNYQVPNIKLTKDQDEMMYNIQMYSFVMNDLVLYLDTNPLDQNAVREFMKLQSDYKRAVKDYENKYGPINLTSDLLEKTPWPWLDNWPFGGKF